MNMRGDVLIKIAELYNEIKKIVGSEVGIVDGQNSMLTDSKFIKKLDIDFDEFEYDQVIEKSEWSMIKFTWDEMEDYILILGNAIDEKLKKLIHLLVTVKDSNTSNQQMAKVISGQIKDVGIESKLSEMLPCWIYAIYHDGSSRDIYEYFTQFYSAVTFVIMGDNEVVILSKVDLLDEEFDSIYDSAQSELLLKISMIQGNYLNEFHEINSSYIELSKLYRASKLINKSNEIYRKKDIIGPIIVNQSEHGFIKKLSESTKSSWGDAMNDELFITAKTFFTNNLNITDTANKLYLHRNTLIYRLNKIEKITGYDIRNFEEGLNLYMILLCDAVKNR